MRSQLIGVGKTIGGAQPLHACRALPFDVPGIWKPCLPGLDEGCPAKIAVFDQEGVPQMKRPWWSGMSACMQTENLPAWFSHRQKTSSMPL